jgi:hypothetical protein
MKHCPKPVQLNDFADSSSALMALEYIDQYNINRIEQQYKGKEAVLGYCEHIL